MMRSSGSNSNGGELLLLDDENMVAAALLHSYPLALDLACYRDAEKEAMRRRPARGRRRKTPVCDGTYYGKGEERRKDGTTRQFGF